MICISCYTRIYFAYSEFDIKSQLNKKRRKK